MSSSEVYDLDNLGYLSDAFSGYLRYIKKYPPLPNDEIYALGVRSIKGDKEAQEKLILHHLAFVVYIAKPYFGQYPHIDPMDIVQYGNEGLMKAVSMYDPNDGALTTYSASWIKQKITRHLGCDFADIKTPVHIQESISKYKRIIYKVDNGFMPMPTDNELREILDVTEEALDLIKEGVNNTFVSMDKEISEGDPLEKFIEDKAVRKPEDIISSIDQFELLIALKKKLKPVHYYIFYMRYFDKREHTLDELSLELGITRERVRQLENDARDKIKALLNNNHINVQKIIKDVKLEEKSKFYKIDEKPLQPKEIIRYLYLRKYFSGIAREVLRELLIHPQKLSLKEEAQKFSMTEKDFNNLLVKMKVKIEKILNDNHEDYFDFEIDMISTYRTKIFEIDLGVDYRQCNHKGIMSRYSKKTHDEIKELYGESFDNLPQDTKRLLHKFFGKEKYRIVDSTFMEREVNLALFNYKEKSTKLAPSLLYPTYLKYKEKFNYEQQLLLECYFFNTRDKKEYDSIPHSTPKNTLMFITVRKLEKCHFGLYNLSYYQYLTKEIYEEMLKKYGDSITDERKRLLNLIYGVECEAKSLHDIVAEHKLDYNKTHDFLKNARDYIMNLYLNRASKKVIDKDVYSKYILNVAYELTPETREILKMHVIDELSYEEISSKTGLTKYRISNIVTEGIRKLDFYRFGIIKTVIVNETILNKFLEKSKSNFTDLECRIIRLRYIRHLTSDMIFKILKEENISEDEGTNKKVSKDFINDTNSKFLNSFNSYLVNDIELSKEVLEELTNKRPLESVISENERKVISYTLALKNFVNPKGVGYSEAEIIKRMNITENQYYHFKNLGLKKLKMYVAGLLSPTDIYMPLDILEKAVQDRHVPISDKERMIINYTCELNGFSHKNFDEIAKITGDSKGSVRRRYQRAIVNINKFLNFEIEEQLNYEADFLPNLKYFNKIDQAFIKEHFEEGLSYEAMAKKHSLTMDKVSAIFDAINARIKDMLGDPKMNKFDYDYAEEVIDNPDLPFWGNLDVAKKIYRLAYGGEVMEKLPMTEIVRRLNLDISTDVAINLLIDFMISIGKYRLGIKRGTTFSYEQIKDYYDRNKDKMDSLRLKSYKVYFNRYEKSVDRRSTFVNDTIRYDLLKEKEDNYFKINKATRKDVLNILRDKKHRINSRVKKSLMQMFEITERELLTGQEINHVIRMLHLLDLSLMREKEEGKNIKKLKRDI